MAEHAYWIDCKEPVFINARGHMVHEVICSECSGLAFFRKAMYSDGYVGAKICPNCGAVMESEPDEEDYCTATTRTFESSLEDYYDSGTSRRKDSASAWIHI